MSSFDLSSSADVKDVKFAKNEMKHAYYFKAFGIQKSLSKSNTHFFGWRINDYSMCLNFDILWSLIIAIYMYKHKFSFKAGIDWYSIEHISAKTQWHQLFVPFPSIRLVTAHPMLGHGGAKAYPSWHWGVGGVKWRQVSSSSQGI